MQGFQVPQPTEALRRIRLHASNRRRQMLPNLVSCLELTLKTFHYHFCRSFDCSSLKTRDATKCHYGTKSFAAGDQLHTPEIEASCTIGCYCRGAEDEQANAQFSCTHIDCPEFFGSSPDPPGKKCIRQYGEHSCCLKDTVCGEITRALSGDVI